MTYRSFLALGLGAAIAVIACGDEDKDDSSEESEEHAAVSGDSGVDECPSDLSYALTGKPLIDKYCLTCHSEKNAKALGDGHIFETEALVREHGHEIYEQVSSGAMPKTGPKPTDAEKKDFLDWLDCSGISAQDLDHDHGHDHS